MENNPELQGDVLGHVPDGLTRDNNFTRGDFHDINNMLGVVIGVASLALEDCREDGKWQNDFQIILDAARKASKISLSAMGSSNSPAGPVVFASVSSVIDDVLYYIEKTVPDSIVIQKEHAHRDVIVGIDPQKLERIIMNLCVNAVEAMPAGGTLLIRTEIVSCAGRMCANCGERISGRYCKIEISDTGMGIPQNVKDHIFTLKVTTKSQRNSNGIGLSIVREILKSCRGHITISSEVSKGTQVELLIPLI